ncbi:MAG: extracellular solute-binding protein, partial [Clostridia bacterium]|nr:extracellular solute-binding protein [Clostridia bacterium]
MKMKRQLSIILALVMILTVLSGCGPKKKNSLYDGEYTIDPVLNPLGSDIICKEPVELEVMITSNGKVLDYETNKYTKELERKGNVDLKFTLLPAGDAQTKVNLTLSSGADLPDILIYNLTDVNVATYGEAGVIIPLNKYYENSSEYLVPQAKQLVEDGGIDLIKYITMSDGNIYTIPQYNESLVNEFSTVLWIYKPWLDKLGMEVPTTLEEFEAALQAFKDNDMNGNGDKNDEIPMVDCTQSKGMIDILQSFIQTGVDDLTIKDGKLEYVYTTDEYKEFLKYMNRLTEKGLYDLTSFSQDNATLKTLVNSAEVRVGVFSHTSTSFLSSAKERRLDYVPVNIVHNNVS